MKFEPVKRFYAMAGAYNGDPRLKEGSLHGVDFSLRGPVFVIGEIGLRRNYKRNSERLSGNLKIGGYYNGGSARLFAAAPAGQPQTERGRTGFYVVADQGLVCWGDPTQDRHLGIFLGFTAAPDQRINRVPYFFDTGLVIYGPSSKRARDLVGLAVVYGSYSRDLQQLRGAVRVYHVLIRRVRHPSDRDRLPWPGTRTQRTIHKEQARPIGL